MARLRDMFEEDELPTRPDNPRVAARRCRHCRKVAGDHVRLRAGRFCIGAGTKFNPEDHSDADRER